jgi:hypothetical protein
MMLYIGHALRLLESLNESSGSLDEGVNLPLVFS